MELRPLGRTGIRVSALGLGTVKLGRNRAVKYPGGEGAALPSDQQVHDLLNAAADVGINLIDTAPAYGISEERIGLAMHAQNWFGGRDRWVLCTKVGEQFDPDTGASLFDFSEASVRASVMRSLARLRTDVLDIVLLHCSDNDVHDLLETGAIHALQQLKREGHIRSHGASTKSTDAGLLALRDSGGACDVVMLTYNPRERRDELVIDAARMRGVGVLIKKALMSGHTSDLAATLPQSLRDIPNAGDAAIAFALNKPGVSSVVVGTSSPDRLRANALITGRLPRK